MGLEVVGGPLDGVIGNPVQIPPTEGQQVGYLRFPASTLFLIEFRVCGNHRNKGNKSNRSRMHSSRSNQVDGAQVGPAAAALVAQATFPSPL